MRSFLFALLSALIFTNCGAFEKSSSNTQSDSDRILIEEQDTPLGHRVIEKDSDGIYWINGIKVDYSEHGEWTFEQWCLAYSNRARRKILRGGHGPNERRLMGKLNGKIIEANNCTELEEGLVDLKDLALTGLDLKSLAPVGSLDMEAIFASMNSLDHTTLKHLWKMPRLQYLNVANNDPYISDCGVPEHLKSKIRCINGTND